MKILLLACTLLVLVHYSQQETKFENCSPQQRNAYIEKDPDYKNKCMVVRCDDSGFSSLICALSRCPDGKQIGFQAEDNSKIYPACCGYPICAN